MDGGLRRAKSVEAGSTSQEDGVTTSTSVAETRAPSVTSPTEDHLPTADSQSLQTLHCSGKDPFVDFPGLINEEQLDSRSDPQPFGLSDSLIKQTDECKPTSPSPPSIKNPESDARTHQQNLDGILAMIENAVYPHYITASSPTPSLSSSWGFDNEVTSTSDAHPDVRNAISDVSSDGEIGSRLCERARNGEAINGIANTTGNAEALPLESLEEEVIPVDESAGDRAGSQLTVDVVDGRGTDAVSSQESRISTHAIMTQEIVLCPSPGAKDICDAAGTQALMSRDGSGKSPTHLALSLASQRETGNEAILDRGQSGVEAARDESVEQDDCSAIPGPRSKPEIEECTTGSHPSLDALDSEQKMGASNDATAVEQMPSSAAMLPEHSSDLQQSRIMLDLASKAHSAATDLTAGISTTLECHSTLALPPSGTLIQEQAVTTAIAADDDQVKRILPPMYDAELEQIDKKDVGNELPDGMDEPPLHTDIFAERAERIPHDTLSDGVKGISPDLRVNQTLDSSNSAEAQTEGQEQLEAKTSPKDGTDQAHGNFDDNAYLPDREMDMSLQEGNDSRETSARHIHARIEPQPKTVGMKLGRFQSGRIPTGRSHRTARQNLRKTFSMPLHEDSVFYVARENMRRLFPNSQMSGAEDATSIYLAPSSSKPIEQQHLLQLDTPAFSTGATETACLQTSESAVKVGQDESLDMEVCPNSPVTADETVGRESIRMPLPEETHCTSATEARGVTEERSELDHSRVQESADLQLVACESHSLLRTIPDSGRPLEKIWHGGLRSSTSKHHQEPEKGGFVAKKPLVAFTRFKRPQDQHMKARPMPVQPQEDARPPNPLLPSPPNEDRKRKAGPELSQKNRDARAVKKLKQPFKSPMLSRDALTSPVKPEQPAIPGDSPGNPASSSESSLLHSDEHAHGEQSDIRSEPGPHRLRSNRIVTERLANTFSSPFSSPLKGTNTTTGCVTPIQHGASVAAGDKTMLDKPDGSHNGTSLMAEINALERQKQLLKQAIKIRSFPQEEDRLRDLVTQWRQAGRDIVEMLFQVMTRPEPANNQNSCTSNWETEPNPSEMNGGPRIPEVEREEEMDAEDWNYGTMMRFLHVDPQLLGWDKEAEDWIR